MINSQDLKQSCFKFMSSNLEHVKDANYFPWLDITCLSAILSMLQSDEVKFQTGCFWLSHEGGSGRLQYADELFSTIDFKNVTLNVITQTIALLEEVEVR